MILSYARNDGTIKFNVTTCMSAIHPITRYVEHSVGVADVDDKSLFIEITINPSGILILIPALYTSILRGAFIIQSSRSVAQI